MPQNYYNTRGLPKPYFHPTITTYKNTRQTSYYVLPYFTLALFCVVLIYALNTQAHTMADNAHAAYCDLASTPREACDPFYQQSR